MDKELAPLPKKDLERYSALIGINKEARTSQETAELSELTIKIYHKRNSE